MDEHVPPYYRTEILRMEPGLTVWAIGDPDAPPSGTKDPDILKWCEANDFILVTNNRKSMPIHLKAHLEAGRHIPGILTIDLIVPMRKMVENLVEIAGASYNDEYRDRIEYLPI